MRQQNNGSFKDSSSDYCKTKISETPLEKMGQEVQDFGVT